MNQSTVIIIAFGAIALFLSTSTVSSLPVINCEPNSISEAPTNIRQLCYYVMETLRSDPSQDNASEMMASRLSDRGIKRQDVDHVFLRFGKRPSYA